MYFLSVRTKKVGNTQLSQGKDYILYDLLNVISVSEIKFRALLKHMRLTQQTQRGLEVEEVSHEVSRAHFS